MMPLKCFKRASNTYHRLGNLDIPILHQMGGPDNIICIMRIENRLININQ